MKHVILPIATAITCVLVAVANVVITRMTGFNLFGFTLWFIIPVGAIGVGMLAAGGAVLAARTFHIKPTAQDAVLMALLAAATMVLIYYLDYMTLVLSDGRKASDLVGFTDYVDLVLTHAHMRVGRGQVDTGAVGQWGYALAAIEFIGFLIGGAIAFVFLKDMWSCGDCGAYLRKLKTKKTKELTFDEASAVIEHFERGDLATLQEVIAFTPPERTFDKKEQKAVVSFNLHGCPKCKSEVVSAKVAAFDGKDWKDVPSLTTRRDLMSGLSLRDRFA